jgi:hypothetical protein
MAIAPKLKAQWFDGKRLWVHLGLTFSGSYVAGGDTLNLTGIGIESSGLPSSWASIQSQNLGSNGTEYMWLQGTTMANGKIGITQGAGVEVTAGAYPASITGDTVNALFYFLFNR